MPKRAPRTRLIDLRDRPIPQPYYGRVISWFHTVPVYIYGWMKLGTFESINVEGKMVCIFVHPNNAAMLLGDLRRLEDGEKPANKWEHVRTVYATREEWTPLAYKIRARSRE